jgi:hypothetical protein
MITVDLIGPLERVRADLELRDRSLQQPSYNLLMTSQNA